MARILADKLGPLLGQGMVVENRDRRRHAGRHRGRSESPCRRLHAAARRALQYRAQPRALRQAALRPAEGLHADRARRHLVLHAGCAQGPALQGSQGADRFRPRQSREDHLRVGRQGLRPARRHGGHRAAGRREAHPRRLSRRAGGLPGHPRRPRRSLLRYLLHRPLAGRRRHGARARRLLQGAPGDASRRAERDGDGRGAARHGELVRAVRARRHARRSLRGCAPSLPRSSPCRRSPRCSPRPAAGS